MWGGSIKAKVKWSLICQPKDKGGLGVHDLGLVNGLYNEKHLASCVNKKRSYGLNGCIQSF